MRGNQIIYGEKHNTSERFLSKKKDKSSIKTTSTKDKKKKGLCRIKDKNNDKKVITITPIHLSVLQK